MIFGISLYGLAAVAVLLALYSVTILGLRTATWALEVFVGSAVAAIVPAHLAIGLLAAIGVGSVWAIKVTQSLTSTRRLPAIAAIWRRTYIAAGIAVLGTIVLGRGHRAWPGDQLAFTDCSALRPCVARLRRDRPGQFGSVRRDRDRRGSRFVGSGPSSRASTWARSRW